MLIICVCVCVFRCGHGAKGGDDPQRELARPGGSGTGGNDRLQGTEKNEKKKSHKTHTTGHR